MAVDTFIVTLVVETVRARKVLELVCLPGLDGQRGLCMAGYCGRGDASLRLLLCQPVRTVGFIVIDNHGTHPGFMLDDPSPIPPLLPVSNQTKRVLDDFLCSSRFELRI